MPDENLKKDLYKTYMKMLENSIGSRLFNSAYVTDQTKNKTFDVLNDGEFSCAFFVSGILKIFSMIDNPHSTVATLLKKLEEDDSWEKVSAENIKPGDVLFWEEMTFEDGTTNEDVGFLIEKNKAISTNYIEKKITSHHPTFDGTRKIEIAYHYKKF